MPVVYHNLVYFVAVKRETREIFRYAVPFATWIALQTFLPATAWAYAVRTAATALVGVWCLWDCRQRARRPLSQCAEAARRRFPQGRGARAEAARRRFPQGKVARAATSPPDFSWASL